MAAMMFLSGASFMSCSKDSPDMPEDTETPDKPDTPENPDEGEGEESGDLPSSEDLEDNTVAIVYNEEGASVVVATNMEGYISASLEGSHVTLSQSESIGDATGEVTYILSGESTDGSFTFEGSYKSTLVLNGLNLTSKEGAAIDIENGKRIKVKLEEGTSNSLADAADGKQKASLYCKGHLEFSGKGSLTVTGNTAHAIGAKEYIEIKNSEITINKAVKDGINCNQYFDMKSGSVTISGVGDDGIQVSYKDDTDRDEEDTGNLSIQGGNLNISVTNAASSALKADNDIIVKGGAIIAQVSGNGIWDSEKSKTKASSCLSADGNVEISEGSLVLTSTGSGGKGINCDNEFNMEGGEVVIITTGGMLVYTDGSLNHNYTGNTDRIDSDYKSAPKGVKADGNVNIRDGFISVSTAGNGGEGIESKEELTVSGGTVVIRAKDDGINSSGNMYIKGGQLDVLSASNDGLDSNKNIYIQRGEVMAFGASSPECGLDAAEGYNVYITGGKVLAAGGGNSVPSSTYDNAQAYVITNLSLTADSSVTIGEGSETYFTFKIPSDYKMGSSDMGGGRPGSNNGNASVLISVPQLVNGNSYTVKSGETSTTATARTSGGSSGPR